MANVDGHAKEPVQAIAAEVNKLRDDLDALLAKLDSDAGITDTNYASTIGTRAALTINGATPSLPS